MNKRLSDGFITNFLPSLDTPRLRELRLSAIGLTSSSGKLIASYLSSPRCRLHVLQCNDNSLGLRGIKPIVRAIRSQNYTLRSIELYTNQLQDEETASDSQTSSDEGQGNERIGLTRNNIQTWRRCESLLKQILLRNILLKREINKQATTLLSYARPLLLRGCRQGLIDNRAPVQLPLQSPNASRGHNVGFLTVYQSFRFKSLPLELQHYVLSFLAPSLSSLQCIRVIDYATSANTLPSFLRLFSTLSRKMHIRSGDHIARIPDPSGIESALGGIIWPAEQHRDPISSTCSTNRCMGSSGSLVCRHEKERMEFLEVVGCDTFELEPGEGTGSTREVFTLSLTRSV
ncbi:hypothetical protein D9756_009249 [Leucocoprinus leucothites]|uniref:RNI-like protein n=1 Tax=Leucocoprinus leucothites TaxID=201217 RepID=A0A8H5CZG0_9AGAR|nr:hypothetical protein D9756_009249 [Leucoagaricus leucothites]